MLTERVSQLEQQADTLLNNRQLPEAQQLYEKICTADDTNAAAWMKLMPAATGRHWMATSWTI